MQRSSSLPASRIIIRGQLELNGWHLQTQEHVAHPSEYNLARMQPRSNVTLPLPASQQNNLVLVIVDEYFKL